MLKDYSPEPEDSRQISDYFGEITENSQPNPLTCIPDAYTLSTTPEDVNEVNKLMIKQFLCALAEVAMSVASRKISR